MAQKCQIFETYGSVNEMNKSEKDGRITLSGVFGVCGTRNNNKRIYEKSNYGKMIAEMQERIARDGGVAGTLEHENSMYVTLENVSHKITAVKIDESGVVTGTIELLDTPKGRIAKAIVEGGLPLFISSRATGQVDRNGNVTLEKLSTYDIVSSPGFSEARLHLNESQIMESLGDNCCYVVNEKDADQPQNLDHDNIDENDMELHELQSRIQFLERKIEKLEESRPDLGKLADGIQTWCIQEFAGGIQEWIESHYEQNLVENITEKLTDKISQEITEKIADGVQKWIIEEYSPEVEKWVVEQYSPEVENWVVEKVAPGIQEWIVEHYSPIVDKWVTESFGEEVKNMIGESLEETRSNKLQSINDTLSLLESMTVSKPQYGSRVITESGAEPYYLQHIPADKRVQYNMASNEIKESIARRARLFDFTTENAVENFWSKINFEDIKPVSNLYEGLDKIDDLRERQIRAQLRRHRIQ